MTDKVSTSAELQNSTSAVKYKKDQNQNDESLVQSCRLTKSTSWFSSLTKRAGRITPSQKRSLDIHCDIDRLQPTLHHQKMSKSERDLQTTTDWCQLSTHPEEVDPAVTTRCHMESLSNFTTRHSRGMKKYQAVIRLNNSINSSSYSDISTLNLTNLDESRSELDLTYHR